MATLTALWAWIVAHPYQDLLGIGAVLSFINGLLPATVVAGPVGKVIHTILDRLSILTRSDAAGTLKWPLIEASILQFVESSLVPAPTPSTKGSIK